MIIKSQHLCSADASSAASCCFDVAELSRADRVTTTVVTLKFGADWGHGAAAFVAKKRTLNMTLRMEHQLARIQQLTSVPHGISCQ
jgi:hypothetical protein